MGAAGEESGRGRMVGDNKWGERGGGNEGGGRGGLVCQGGMGERDRKNKEVRVPLPSFSWSLLAARYNGVVRASV